ncbi:uncharacterized protein LOC106090968 [Stomoxys calcitrans]|uniref:uncharacterized protein LOC106090968 n=1 Tax=Stomoxys calcitrans TaxID=35570 RepID=UPI0027E30ECD|nr:uncharacterized protein LOC106090968 [Stomoxys calcitrans]XP_059226612.1 uncharacterized protein LOC106090968 [Stomoxys calcitrans]
MAGSKWPFFIAGFSIFFFSLSSLYYIGGLMGLYNFLEYTDDESSENSTETATDPYMAALDGEDLKSLSRGQVAEMTFELLMDVAVLVSSVFLYVGLKKKFPNFISPWLIISFLHVVVGSVWLFVIFGDDDNSFMEEAVNLFLEVFVSAMWYPIYKQYKAIRNPKEEIQPTSQCNAIREFDHHKTATAPREV